MMLAEPGLPRYCVCNQGPAEWYIIAWTDDDSMARSLLTTAGRVILDFQKGIVINVWIVE